MDKEKEKYLLENWRKIIFKGVFEFFNKADEIILNKGENNMKEPKFKIGQKVKVGKRILEIEELQYTKRIDTYIYMMKNHNYFYYEKSLKELEDED